MIKKIAEKRPIKGNLSFGKRMKSDKIEKTPKRAIGLSDLEMKKIILGEICGKDGTVKKKKNCNGKYPESILFHHT